MLEVVDVAVADVFAAMEDIEDDSWCCDIVLDCCCIDVEDALDASATSAAVLEDRFVDDTAVADVADSMANDEDFLTEDDATCEECNSCLCCCVKEARLDSSTVLGSTTTLDPLKEPFLSKDDDASRSAEDFLA
jgi:hypothetical protein